MIGKHIQNYQVSSHLGQGGMGTVYRATDTILGREVALKMLHTPMISQPTVLERFKKEAQVLAKLLHPNIAVIYNLIEQDQQHFMVMEFVEGKDLEGLLKQHRALPPLAVASAFIQGLEGLHHAHRKGIFHRDIKPSNLILTPEGVVKLMDFGIARVAGEQRMTQVNRVIGTVEFLAPELIEGKDPSAASDIYAVGMTMYELLCGKLPFESTTDFNLMQEILKKKPVSPDKLNRSVPAPLAAIVMKALEKRPENRYADAKAFQRAIEQAFPQARDADITYLFSNVVIPVASYAGTATAATRVASGSQATVVMATPAWRSSLSKLRPAYLLRMIGLPGVFRNFLQRVDRRMAIISLSIIAIVITTTVLVLSKDGTSADANESAPIVQQSPKKEEQRVDDNGGGFVPVNNTIAEDQQPAGPVIEGTGKAEETKPTDTKTTDKKKEAAVKKEEKREEEVAPVKKEEADQKPVVVVPDPVVDVKPRASQSMVVSGRAEVALYLNEALTEQVREGQALRFTVSSAVKHQGQVVIERGATALGRVKNVGNKKITVVLQSVTGVNGQSLPLQQTELSGRINEIISNRNYSGFIKKGTVINY